MKKANFKMLLFFGGVFLTFFIAPLSVRAEETTSTPLLVEEETTSTLPIFDPESSSSVLPQSSSSTEPSAFLPALLTPVVNFNLRYLDKWIFSGMVTTTYYDSLADSSGQTHPLAASSTILSALIDADALSDSFSISSLKYYDSFKSFYLDCLLLQDSTSTSACGNWNYAVDGNYPSLGMDNYALKGGENIFVYFGNPWKITASTSTFPVSATTTLSTWRYAYDNLQEEWTADSFDQIDISIPNPNPLGWWDTTITTSTFLSNASGTAELVFSGTGTYYAKITSADYSKWSWPITLTVLDKVLIPAASTTTSTAEQGNNSSTTNSGGSGGQTAPVLISEAVLKEKAQTILNFLQSQQSSEGKIIDGGVSDWAIMSFAAANQYAQNIKRATSSLLSFAQSYDFTDGSDLNFCASYPRHILAFLASGLPPTDVLAQSLVSKIKSGECYNNHLFGQNGINDDVFGLLALLAVGTSISEPIVNDMVETIIADQKAEGSFTWAGFPSPDITGAALDALRFAADKGAAVNQEVFGQAKIYLKTQQLADGGWGFGASDVLTTSWAMMGINSLSESQNEWTTASGKNPWFVLVEQLNPGGYYESAWAPGTIDWFATKHAVPALLGKKWPITLDPLPAPESARDIPAVGGGNFASGQETSRGGSSETLTSTSTLLNLLTPAPVMATSSTSTVENHALPEGENPAIIGQTVSPSPPAITSSLSSLAQTGQNFSRPEKKKLEIKKAVRNQPALVKPNLKPLPVAEPPSVEKKVATGAVAGSAIVLGSTTLLLFLRIILAVL